MRHMWDEFKDFAMKGNALDLAIGVIIGAAFSPMVTTLVANVIVKALGMSLTPSAQKVEDLYAPPAAPRLKAAS